MWSSKSRWPLSPKKPRRWSIWPTAKGLKLTSISGNRWNPTYQSIRDSVQSGEIGDPVMSYSRTSDTIWVPRTMLSWAGKSGPQWFLFAHTMDMVRWILGQEAREVFAIGEKKILKSEGIDAYDAIQAVVRFDNSFATFETSWIVPDAFPHIVESQLTINGSNGRLHLDGAHQGFEISSDQVGKHMYARPSLWTYFQLPVHLVGCASRYGRLRAGRQGADDFRG